VVFGGEKSLLLPRWSRNPSDITGGITEMEVKEKKTNAIKGGQYYLLGFALPKKQVGKKGSGPATKLTGVVGGKRGKSITNKNKFQRNLGDIGKGPIGPRSKGWGGLEIWSVQYIGGAPRLYSAIQQKGDKKGGKGVFGGTLTRKLKRSHQEVYRGGGENKRLCSGLL